MSNIVLSPNAAGTGQFTIASPNSNTNQTISLPDATGTVALNTTIQPFVNNTVLAQVQAVALSF